MAVTRQSAPKRPQFDDQKRLPESSQQSERIYNGEPTNLEHGRNPPQDIDSGRRTRRRPQDNSVRATDSNDRESDGDDNDCDHVSDDGGNDCDDDGDDAEDSDQAHDLMSGESGDELEIEPNEVSERRDPGFKLTRRLSRATRRLENRFADIIRRYGRNFDDEADEIDLETGEIVVNRGHLDSLADGSVGGVWRGKRQHGAQDGDDGGGSGGGGDGDGDDGSQSEDDDDENDAHPGEGDDDDEPAHPDVLARRAAESRALELAMAAWTAAAPDSQFYLIAYEPELFEILGLPFMGGAALGMQVMVPREVLARFLTSTGAMLDAASHAGSLTPWAEPPHPQPKGFVTGLGGGLGGAAKQTPMRKVLAREKMRVVDDEQDELSSPSSKPALMVLDLSNGMMPASNILPEVDSAMDLREDGVAACAVAAQTSVLQETPNSRKSPESSQLVAPPERPATQTPATEATFATTDHGPPPANLRRSRRIRANAEEDAHSEGSSGSAWETLESGAPAVDEDGDALRESGRATTPSSAKPRLRRGRSAAGVAIRARSRVELKRARHPATDRPRATGPGAAERGTLEDTAERPEAAVLDAADLEAAGQDATHDEDEPAVVGGQRVVNANATRTITIKPAMAVPICHPTTIIDPALRAPKQAPQGLQSEGVSLKDAISETSPPVSAGLIEWSSMRTRASKRNQDAHITNGATPAASTSTGTTTAPSSQSQNAPARARGRPRGRKLDVKTSQPALAHVDNIPAQPSVPKDIPTRPKAPTMEALAPAQAMGATSPRVGGLAGQLPAKRGRGRPRKIIPPVVKVDEEESGILTSATAALANLPSKTSAATSATKSPAGALSPVKPTVAASPAKNVCSDVAYDRRGTRRESVSPKKRPGTVAADVPADLSPRKRRSSLTMPLRPLAQPPRRPKGLSPAKAPSQSFFEYGKPEKTVASHLSDASVGKPSSRATQGLSRFPTQCPSDRGVENEPPEEQEAPAETGEGRMREQSLSPRFEQEPEVAAGAEPGVSRGAFDARTLSGSGHGPPLGPTSHLHSPPPLRSPTPTPSESSIPLLQPLSSPVKQPIKVKAEPETETVFMSSKPGRDTSELEYIGSRSVSANKTDATRPLALFAAQVPVHALNASASPLPAGAAASAAEIGNAGVARPSSRSISPPPALISSPISASPSTTVSSPTPQPKHSAETAEKNTPLSGPAPTSQAPSAEDERPTKRRKLSRSPTKKVSFLATSDHQVDAGGHNHHRPPPLDVDAAQEDSSVLPTPPGSDVRAEELVDLTKFWDEFRDDVRLEMPVGSRWERRESRSVADGDREARVESLVEVRCPLSAVENDSKLHTEHRGHKRKHVSNEGDAADKHYGAAHLQPEKATVHPKTPLVNEPRVAMQLSESALGKHNKELGVCDEDARRERSPSIAGSVDSMAIHIDSLLDDSITIHVPIFAEPEHISAIVEAPTDSPPPSTPEASKKRLRSTPSRKHIPTLSPKPVLIMKSIEAPSPTPKGSRARLVIVPNTQSVHRTPASASSPVRHPARARRSILSYTYDDLSDDDCDDDDDGPPLHSSSSSVSGTPIRHYRHERQGSLAISSVMPGTPSSSRKRARAAELAHEAGRRGKDRSPTVSPGGTVYVCGRDGYVCRRQYCFSCCRDLAA